MNKKKSHDSRGDVEDDRISTLPDEVLTHILSFFSTKDAVRTCVLAKRWRNTWATVPVLDFNFYEFFKDDLDGYRGEEGRKYVASFERFVCGVLDNHESTNLDIVRYFCRIQRCEDFIPMEWLDRVARPMPRMMHILIDSSNFYSDNSVDLPDLVFSSARLEHLKMGLYTNKKTIIRPTSIILPSLKDLDLRNIELPNDFTQKLFMGCPSLERLYLCSCDLYFSSISSNVLKNLVIVECPQFEHLQISCPGLVSLSICSHFQMRGVGISLKKTMALVNASIKLLWWPWFHGGHDGVPVLDLLSGLTNVTQLMLHFNSDLKESVEKDISNCRNFINLKTLYIGMWDMSSDFYLIACLIKSSPNLNELTLVLDMSRGEIQEQPRREVLADAFFRHEYLETVNISNARGMTKLPSECFKTLIKALDKYVKKIGNINIS